MRITTRKVDGAVVVDLTGRITCGEPQLLLRETVRRFIEDGSYKFILNFTEVNFVDSSALGELCSIKNKLDKYGGQACLLRVSAKVSDLLVMTKLVCVFESFDEESLAVQALHSDLAVQAADSPQQ